MASLNVQFPIHVDFLFFFSFWLFCFHFDLEWERKWNSHRIECDERVKWEWVGPWVQMGVAETERVYFPPPRSWEEENSPNAIALHPPPRILKQKSQIEGVLSKNVKESLKKDDLLPKMLISSPLSFHPIVNYLSRQAPERVTLGKTWPISTLIKENQCQICKPLTNPNHPKPIPSHRITEVWLCVRKVNQSCCLCSGSTVD